MLNVSRVPLEAAIRESLKKTIAVVLVGRKYGRDTSREGHLWPVGT